jgi:hypothetical protein
MPITLQTPVTPVTRALFFGKRVVLRVTIAVTATKQRSNNVMTFQRKVGQISKEREGGSNLAEKRLSNGAGTDYKNWGEIPVDSRHATV